jgi:hypothetical protein
VNILCQFISLGVYDSAVGVYGSAIKA